ncbi:MAG: hypothetical protein U1F18_08330 [Steroidobacteraceae bacterium]
MQRVRGAGHGLDRDGRGMAGLEVPPPVVGLACAAMMKGLAMLAAPSLPPSPLDGGPWTPLRLGAIALARRRVDRRRQRADLPGAHAPP